MMVRFALAVVITLAAYAQVLPVGTADGTIADPSGAVLPDAKVTLTQRDTDQARTVVTNDAGYFYVPLLPPGPYTISAEKQGFKRGVQDIEILTGRRTTADLVLQLGQVTDSVQVTGQAPLLETSSASVSRNIQNRQVQDLPLAGRNPLKLMALAAGVTTNSTSNSSLEDISGTSYASVNGSNRRLNEFLIDGIPNNVRTAQTTFLLLT
ncbi:MAG: carboxypeptidase-like regulatory domain-containing protein, partial [Bryobacteraceae bacterium]